MSNKKVLVLIAISFLSFVSCATKILIEHLELESSKYDFGTEQIDTSQNK